MTQWLKNVNLTGYLPNFCLISGAIFEQGTDEIQSAFKYAMLTYNMNASYRRFELQAFVDVINTADAFKLSRLSKYCGSFIKVNICTQ